jgi:hypothetical protein
MVFMTSISNKKYYSTKVTKITKAKAKIKQVVSKIKPSSTLDYLSLGFASVKSSLGYFIKAFGKIKNLIAKNPIFGPIYTLFVKVLLPLSIIFYLLKKYRQLRFFI